MAILTSEVNKKIRFNIIKNIVNILEASFVGAKSPKPTVVTVAEIKNMLFTIDQPS